MNYEKYHFFTEPSPFLEKFLIVSDGMGMQETDKFLIDRKNFNNNLIMITLKGELFVEQNDKILTLKSGEGVIMDLMTKHKYYVNKKTGAKFVWLHFRGKPCDSIMEKLSYDKKLPFLFSDNNMRQRIYNCFQTVSEEEYEYKISSIIYELVVNISKMAYSENSDNFLKKLNNYIEKNIFSDINLDDFAKSQHLSKYYFCRYFKGQTNMTPMNYVGMKKIEAAKMLLVTSNDKIDAISNELGFTDRSHFSKTFKKYTGKTPVEYRNEYLNY